MPRLTTRLPRYRKHKATGQAVVTIGGVDHYLGRHGSKASRFQYDRLLAEWLAAGRVATTVNEVITVVEVSAAYLRFARVYYRKNGKSTGVFPSIKLTLRYLCEWYGREPAAEFGPIRLKALRQRFIDAGNSRKYVNDHVDRIKRMFKWAAAEELRDESVYRRLALVEGLKRGRTEARETAPVMPIDDATVEETRNSHPSQGIPSREGTRDLGSAHRWPSPGDQPEAA